MPSSNNALGLTLAYFTVRSTWEDSRIQDFVEILKIFAENVLMMTYLWQGQILHSGLSYGKNLWNLSKTWLPKLINTVKLVSNEHFLDQPLTFNQCLS